MYTTATKKNRRRCQRAGDPNLWEKSPEEFAEMLGTEKIKKKGRYQDDAVTMKVPVSVRVDQLIPMQNQIGLKDSLGYSFKSLPDQVNAFVNKKTDKKKNLIDSNGKLVARIVDDNDAEKYVVVADLGHEKMYVLDGHHRWSKVWMLGGREMYINVLVLKFPNIKRCELGDLKPCKSLILNALNAAIVLSNPGEEPKFTAADTETDVYHLNEKEISNWLKNNISDNLKSSTNKIMENIIDFKETTSPYSMDAPNRKYMPQTDAHKKTPSENLAQLLSGNLDITPDTPTPKGNQAGGSRNRRKKSKSKRKKRSKAK